MPPLVLAVMVYVATTNIQTLRALLPIIPPQFEFRPPGPGLYEEFLYWQCWLATAFAVIVGPPLVTRDFANGAMPLFLSKSLRRGDYVLGRCLVLFGLLSLATWVPYLVIFVLECGMAKPEWRAANWGLFPDIILAGLPTALLLTLLIVAVSAFVQRANLARAALLFLLLGVKPLMFPLEMALGTPAVRVVSPTDVTASLREWAFEPSRAPGDAAPTDGITPRSEGGTSGPPAGLSAFALVAWLAGATWLLLRRVRPVEVVK